MAFTAHGDRSDASGRPTKLNVQWDIGSAQALASIATRLDCSPAWICREAVVEWLERRPEVATAAELAVLAGYHAVSSTRGHGRKGAPLGLDNLAQQAERLHRIRQRVAAEVDLQPGAGQEETPQNRKSPRQKPEAQSVENLAAPTHVSTPTYTDLPLIGNAGQESGHG